MSFDASGNPVGISSSNFVEGMIVYDTTNNCVKIFDGSVWSCYIRPACPTGPSFDYVTTCYNTSPALSSFSFVQGSPASGSFTIPLSVMGSGNIPSVANTVSGLTLTTSAIASANSGNTSLSVIISGTPTAAEAIIIPLTINGITCNFLFNVTSNIAQYTCTSATTNGTYIVGSVVTAANTLTLVLNVTQVGNYPAMSYTAGGVTFSTPAGTFASTGPKTLTLNASGTPTTVGINNLTANPSTLCAASYTAVSPGTATINCGNATLLAGDVPLQNSAASMTYTLPYTSGNGGVYPAISVASTGVLGLMATAPSGVFANGSGSITVTISGTATTSGDAMFSINIGGSTCNIVIPVLPTSNSITNCSSPNKIIGRSISKNSSSPTNLTIGSKSVGAWISSTSGYFTFANSFCSPGLLFITAMCGVDFSSSFNDIMRLRGAASSIGAGSVCNNGSITIYFNKPVNDFTVLTTWIGGDLNTVGNPDSFNVTTDTGGTLTADGSINSCNLVTVTPNGSVITVTGSGVNINDGGGAIRVRSTVPYKSITLTGTAGDDVIIAYGYCDAVAY